VTGGTDSVGWAVKTRSIVAAAVANVEPAAPTVQVPVGVKTLLAPAQVIVTPVTVAEAVPVLTRDKYARLVVTAVEADAHVYSVERGVPMKAAAGATAAVTWIFAVAEAEPKIPKTKPPIATAAIRVTAIIRTVAMMGEIAFFCAYIPFLIFISLLYTLISI
jgi:hypothetical protein